MFTPIYFLLLFAKVLVQNKLETIIKKKMKRKKKSKTGPSAESLKSMPWSKHYCPQFTDKKTQLEKSNPQERLGLSEPNVRWGLSCRTQRASWGKHALPTICLEPPRYGANVLFVIFCLLLFGQSLSVCVFYPWSKDKS